MFQHIVKKKIYEIASTTFCQFSKLNKGKLYLNKMAKKITKCSSVPFETCKLHLMFIRYFCEPIYFRDKIS